jgi:hypothetical protein
MNADDVIHVLMGRPMLDTGRPHLEDDPALWEEVWSNLRDGMVAHWISRSPGTRPPAWWRFSSPCVPRREGESEPEYLYRMGEIGADELETIRIRAVRLVEYNRGRRRERPGDNFIPAGSLHRFAARRGLISAEEAAILGLDANGDDIPAAPANGRVKREPSNGFERPLPRRVAAGLEHDHE